jgi:microcystin-dependent protein
LYAAILNAHGSGDGTTTFALPDYRGRFIRGRANSSANDPNRATRTAAAAGGATGDAVGSVQVNATAKNGLTASSSAPTFTGTPSQATATMNSNTSHNHNFSYNPSGGNSAAPGQFTQGVNFYSTGSGTLTTIGMQNTNIDHSHNFTASGTVSTPTITVAAGDSETRPLNAYVNYIIKI